MNVDDLVVRYERRRAEALRIGAMAPAAKVYDEVLEDIRRLDGTPETGRMVDTAEAARLLSLCSTTIRRKCAAGEIEGAVKTSGATGDWRMPIASIYRMMGRRAEATTAPRLWSPNDG